jgi:pimeloyl-ACP methyl ester carboxylesterase
MRHRALAGLLAAIVTVATGVVSFGTVPAGASSPSQCGESVRRVSERDEGTPILFVHGFAGAPSDFRHELGGRPSMFEAIGDLDGAVTYSFDYSDHSLEWVTDPAIGRRLARAIVCLAEEHDRPVTIVAHSMGGLATRQAQGELIDDRRVSRSIARVVTVGTPFDGAQLLGFGGGIAGDIASELITTALRACNTDFARTPALAPPAPASMPTRRPGDRTFCSLLGATETAAVQGMIPDSDELAALPSWGRDVRIVPVAADIDVGVAGPFGLSETFSVGDFAVSVASATADASRGVRPFVARCRASLFGIVDAVDESPCSHANELANRRIVRHVRQVVARSTDADLDGQGVGVVNRPARS